MKKAIIFLILLSLSLLYACEAEKEEIPGIAPPETETPKIEVSSGTLDFPRENLSRTITVNTDYPEWSAQVDASGTDWCTVLVQPKSLKVSVTENVYKEVRETQIDLIAGGSKKQILVRQLGIGPAILVSPNEFILKVAGGDVTFEITTNVNFSISELPEWIKPKPETRATPMVTSTHQYTVEKNEKTEQRNAVIALKDNDSELYAEVKISQGGDIYVFNPDAAINEDVKIKIVSGKASSYHTGENIEKSFDGDFTTLYHSHWTNTGANYFPITLDYNFNNAEKIDYLVYYPRSSGSNGLFKETEIQVKHTGESAFVKVMDKDFLGLSSATRVTFDEPLERVETIRFIVKSGAGDGKGFASCAEMGFYAKNPNNFDPFILFADAACTELKQGITEEEIEACENPFFKKMAQYMFKDNYPREFRIAEYRAYPHPSEDAYRNKTAEYSLLDNPTGISVAEGEELIVLVSGTGDYPLSLKIQNLDNPSGSGFGQGASYSLSEGSNKVISTSKGLAYIMYHTTDFQTAPKVKIHFATGTVNGYFDGTKHTSEDWNRLLAAATDKYFDVIGQYAHFTFPTASFRNYTGSRGKEFIDLYDRLVYLEMEFLGLTDFGGMFRNHMYFAVVYGTNFMFAAGNYTGYHEKTLVDLCDVSKLKNEHNTPDIVWGPAHEVGHINQARPGFKWVGMTEVTNNLCSMYVQTSFGNPTRLQTESMQGEGGYTNRYEKAMNRYFTVENRPHNVSGEDVFCKLIPFWQLKLYLNDVLGKTGTYGKGFYQDVYEAVRNTDRVIENKRTGGQHQLEFVKTVCRLAQLNLEDFFVRWGFLVPINETIDDYGTGKMEVTQSQIDAVLNEIRAYSKPAHKFEYITDNTASVYKSGLEIVKGSATRSGQTFTMTNWQNVAAYEVRDAEGKLVFLSVESRFTMNTSWKTGYQVFAVSITGQETQVTF